MTICSGLILEILKQSHYPETKNQNVFSEATAFLKDLGGRIAAVTKERRAVEFLLQRISVAIQRGNAACVLGTTPDCNRNLDDIFYIV